MNHIQSAVYGIGQSFTSYCSNTTQLTLATLHTTGELFTNLKFFQRIFQISTYCLELAMLRDPVLAASLSRLSITLKTVGMHDFYAFLKKPRQWFRPINAYIIDENKLLDSNGLSPSLSNGLSPSLSDILYTQFKEKFSLNDTPELKADLRNIAYFSLKEQLEFMDNKDMPLHNVEEFKKALEKRLNSPEFRQRLQRVYSFDPSAGWNFNQLNNIQFDLDAVSVSLRHKPFIEQIITYHWNVVDIGCVASYLKDWKLLDTAKWSERIGRYQAFHWVKNQHLDQWVVGLVLAGTAWELLEAHRKLRDDRLTEEERWQTQLVRITSAAGLVLWGPTFLNMIGKTAISPLYIYSFGILTRTLEAYSIAVMPKKHEFFQQSAESAA